MRRRPSWVLHNLWHTLRARSFRSSFMQYCVPWYDSRRMVLEHAVFRPRRQYPLLFSHTVKFLPSLYAVLGSILNRTKFIEFSKVGRRAFQFSQNPSNRLFRRFRGRLFHFSKRWFILEHMYHTEVSFSFFKTITVFIILLCAAYQRVFHFLK